MSEAVKGWRIYYGDGSTFDSSEGAWEQALVTGVQFVLIFEEKPYRMPLYGFDEYWLPGRPEGPRLVGSLIPDEDFEAMREQVMNDYDWPGE